MTRPRRYVVIGAGGVGAALAAGLDEIGIPVVLVSRGATYAAIVERGLLYHHRGTTRTLEVAVAAGPDDVQLRPTDILVLATKTQDAAATLADWAWRSVEGAEGPSTGADLPLLTLQNGLETERVAARYFPTVVAATTLIAAKHVVPGEVLVANAPKVGQVILGAYPSASTAPTAAAVAQLIAEDLRDSGWLVQDVETISRWKAWKLSRNVSNATELLTGPAEQLGDLRDRVVVEAELVLDAAGYVLADPATELTYDASLAAIAPDSGYRPGQQSTWQSFVRGSTSEVDFLNGEIALLARTHGVLAPLNTAVQRVIGRSAALGEAPGAHHVDEVLELAAGRTIVPEREGANA